MIRISCNNLRQHGGAERYILDVVGELNRRGAQVECFAQAFDVNIPEYKFVIPRSLGLRIIPHKLRDWWRDNSLTVALKNLPPRPLLAFNRVRQADIAICMGTHRGWLVVNGKRPGLGDREQIERESDCYRHATHVVAHSEVLALELQKLYGLSESKIIVLHPPVRRERFHEVSAERRVALREAYGFSDDEAILVLPSMDHKRKGLSEIVAAIETSGLRLRLIVAGRKAQSTASVTSLGYVVDIENLYRAADFCILASKYEPFGLGAVESVLCGTPAIVSSCVGALEVLSPEAVMVYDSARPGDLAGTLRTAYDRARTGRARLEGPSKHLTHELELSEHATRLLELVDDVERSNPRFRHAKSGGDHIAAATEPDGGAPRV